MLLDTFLGLLDGYSRSESDNMLQKSLHSSVIESHTTETPNVWVRVHEGEKEYEKIILPEYYRHTRI